jgi:7-carboxy-7-deazaguanine synthase
MTPTEIFNTVFKMGCPRVTLTGGEPLIHEDVDELIEYLTDGGFEVNIETNGSVDIECYTRNSRTVITMDYKCPSSGMCGSMNIVNIGILRPQDVLKFVVGSVEDLNACRDLVKYTQAQVFISPVFGKIEPKEIVEYMLEHDMQNCRIQLQLHKYIWPVDMRGV